MLCQQSRPTISTNLHAFSSPHKQKFRLAGLAVTPDGNTIMPVNLRSLKPGITAWGDSSRSTPACPRIPLRVTHFSKRPESRTERRCPR